MDYKKKLRSRLNIAITYIVLGVMFIVGTFITKTENDFISTFGFMMIVRIKYGETIFLFTGDAEHEIEKQLLKSDIDADVLKVGHHGAGSSSDPSFIKKVSPEVAVISSGGEYGHPHSDTLAILNDVGADIYRTDEQGTVVVTADQNKKVTVDKKSSTIK